MNRLKPQAGVSLLEVLITVVILSISLLAMASLQTQSIKLNQSAMKRSQANTLAYEIMDRIRINRGENSSNIVNYNYSYEEYPLGNTTTTSATPETIATQDVKAWKAEIDKNLPLGKGAIQCLTETRFCLISIKWSEQQIFGTEDEDNPEATTEFVYQTYI